MRRGIAGARGTAIVLLFFALPATTWAGEPAPLGHLLLNGGGGEAGGFWTKLFELAGGKEAPIVVLPTASSRPEAGQEYVDELVALGATHARALELRARADAERPEFIDAISRARAIFFTGGDQSRITRALLGSPAGAAVAEAYRRGAVLAGTSAGLACMSERMLTGEGDFTKLLAGNVEVVEGLGFVTEAILDQHFVARSRESRLLSAVLEHPGLLGIGVDEKTAVWIAPDRTLEVLGEGWVVIFDARTSAVRRRSDAGGTRLAVDALTTRILLSGERFDLKSGLPLPPR
jgi:cyanophycinase